MANLKEIRNRISSVSSTIQITNAMKMVSAAKLKKAQDAIVAIRSYSDKLNDIIQEVSPSIERSEFNYLQGRPVESVLFVLISSNRGLCGSFNANIIKTFTTHAKEKFPNKNVEVVFIGKKAEDVLARKIENTKNFNDIYNDLTFESASKIADDIMKGFDTKQYDKVYLVYNQFKNAANQNTVVEDFLPISFDETENKNNQKEYLLEPEEHEVIKEVLPKLLKTQLLKAIKDSFVSEHGARMTAMHKATDNALELLETLKLTYNKARQTAITNEILEIVGGAEALKSK